MKTPVTAEFEVVHQALFSERLFWHRLTTADSGEFSPLGASHLVHEA